MAKLNSGYLQFRQAQSFDEVIQLGTHERVRSSILLELIYYLFLSNSGFAAQMPSRVYMCGLLRMLSLVKLHNYCQSTFLTLVLQ